MRRTYVNIGAFFVLAIALIAWSVFNYVPLGFLENPKLVTAEFTESPGLRAGYEVTYLGNSVGRIDAVRLAPGVSEVVLALDADADVPADAVAFARRRSAIGEPYVDLAPAPDTDGSSGPRMADGDRIPADRTQSPIEYGELFRSLDVLVNSLDAQALATVVDELADAVDGRGDDVRRIIAGAREVAVTAAENGDQIESLIADLGTVASVLATNREAIGTGIEDLATVAESLAAARGSLEAALDETPAALTLVNDMVEAADDALICTIDGLSVLQLVLDAEGQAAAEELLERSARFAHIATAIRDPDDGIFNLLITATAGDPPALQYTTPITLPEVAPLQPCPAHSTAVSPTPADSSAPVGTGGARPGADAPASDVAAPGAPGADQVASGTSDVVAPESALASAARVVIPLFAVASVGALLWAFLLRRKDEQS